jgi:hypothetical protein
VNRVRRILPLLIIFLASAPAASADDLSDMRRACLERNNFQKGIHWLEECMQELFNAQPMHIALTTVAPGAGTAGFGPSVNYVVRPYRFEFLLRGTAAVSEDGSYITQAQTIFALPGRSISLEQLRHTLVQKYRLHIQGRQQPQELIDAKTSITLRWRRIGAREQDFYGLGPDSSFSGRTSYGIILNETYAAIDSPFSSWNSVGFEFSFLQPRVTSSINTSVPEMSSVYTEATAPGLTFRDDFLRFAPYITFRIPAHRSYNISARAGYAVYHAMGDPGHSFQQLLASSKVAIPVWLPVRGTPSFRKNWFLNGVCPSLRSGMRCSLGDFAILGSVAASYKVASSQVPVYFDQTLGGTNFSGQDTLRGYADYRFRGPSSVLFQAEYRHPLWGPFGLLSFYDTGKVALLPSDLNLSHLHHDIGLGMYLRIANRELARVYIGFGTGEPSQIHPKFPTP